MLDERLAVAKADGQRAQMHVVEHFFGFLKAAHLEGDNAAEPRHLAGGHGVIGMVLQTGIEHLLHILGAGEEVHHLLRVGADGVHMHLECLETAQDQKRLLRTEHRARDALETDHADLVHDLLARHRETCDHIAVAVEILGRAVHDNIRAQLQRLHQQRRGEGVVHDDDAVRILCMRVVRDGGDVRDFHAGVGNGLKVNDLRVRANGCFHLRHVRHVDAVGVDAEARQWMSANVQP